MTRLLLSILLIVVHSQLDGLWLRAQNDELQPAPNRAPVSVRPVQDLTIAADVPFKFSLRATGLVCFGYGDGGKDITVRDNYCVNHIRFAGSFENLL